MTDTLADVAAADDEKLDQQQLAQRLWRRPRSKWVELVGPTDC
jgi:hypothetical protein